MTDSDMDGVPDGERNDGAAEQGAAPTDPLRARGWYIAADGWVSVPAPDDVVVRLRVRPAGDGRFVLTDLMVSAPRITIDMLRGLQLSRIEATFNLYREDLERAGEYLTAGDPEFGGLLAVQAVSEGRPDDDLTLGELRARAPRPPAEEAPAPRLPALRPDGTDPEGFYGRVAEVYRHIAARSRRPAVQMAEQAEVPITTVHRWIREARRRGLLPPTEKGKAG